MADRAEQADLLRELAAQEETLQFVGCDNDAAWDLGVLMRELAQQRGHELVIEIRRHGQVLFHAATAGTSPDNDDWLARKRRVVERFGRSSYAVGLRAAYDGGSFTQSWGLDPTRYAADGGGFPLRVRGTGVVGTIAVSGLAAAEDHAFVVEAVTAYLSRRPVEGPAA